MDNLILSAIVFVLCFIVRLLIYVLGKKKKGKKKRRDGIAVDMQYLINRFKLDKKKVDKISIAAVISILDAIIIAGTLVATISITDNIALELIIGLIVVMALIIIIYEIFGRILVKKGYGVK